MTTLVNNVTPEVIADADAKSFAPEVIADDSGQWSRNGLRFRTRAEAESWARALSWRWMLVREYRAAATMDEPNQPDDTPATA